MATDMQEDVINLLRTLTKEPEQFLRTQPKKNNSVNILLQQIYETAAKRDLLTKCSVNVLNELVIDNMDEEQIWQQVELRNNIVFPQFLNQTTKLLSLQTKKLEIRLNENNKNYDEEDSTYVDYDLKEAKNNHMQNEDGSDSIDNNVAEVNSKIHEPTKNYKSNANMKKKMGSSVVDDKFFTLTEMNAFLEAEDIKEINRQKGNLNESDEDKLDYFADNLGDICVEKDEQIFNPTYKDFFEKKNSGNSNEVKDVTEKHTTSLCNVLGGEKSNNEENSLENRFQNSNYEKDENSSDESENSNLIQTRKDPRQERLLQDINDYEKIVLSEKPWQLKGEIQGSSRPSNSLLEEILEFESTVRPEPIISENTTQNLENIIKRRIKDQAWNDVVFKVRSSNTPQEYRQKLFLNQEKSKDSLAQIYENEYQREIDKLDPYCKESVEIESKEHKEIRTLTRTVFIQLDALSNFYFTPKPVSPDAKIVTNTLGISMEEVAPISVNDSKLLAPKEVFRSYNHELLTKSERTRTDKNRERRKKKNKQRSIHKLLEVKNMQHKKFKSLLPKKDGNSILQKSVTKYRNVEEIKSSGDKKLLKTSSTFFAKLQDTTTNSSEKPQKRVLNAKYLSGKKLKL